jgi:hypothetical protein
VAPGPGVVLTEASGATLWGDGGMEGTATGTFVLTGGAETVGEGADRPGETAVTPATTAGTGVDPVMTPAGLPATCEARDPDDPLVEPPDGAAPAEGVWGDAEAA